MKYAEEHPGELTSRLLKDMPQSSHEPRVRPRPSSRSGSAGREKLLPEFSLAAGGRKGASHQARDVHDDNVNRFVSVGEVPLRVK